VIIQSRFKSDQVATANDPTLSKPIQNVSATNETPTNPGGAHDSPLIETVEEAEKMRTMQAPNRAGIWSRSQRPREQAMVGPRFEQTIMEDQVCYINSKSALPHFCILLIPKRGIVL
jgi:NADH dehydrogenase (ubiquinone) Fe-S protein 6